MFKSGDQTRVIAECHKMRQTVSTPVLMGMPWLIREPEIIQPLRKLLHLDPVIVVLLVETVFTKSPRVLCS